MYAFFVVSLCSLLFVAFSNGSPENYGKSEDEAKIVGGFEANKEDYPYAVSLRSHNNAHFCGGTLIDETHVLTAAHCVTEGYTSSVIVGSDSLDKGGISYKITKKAIVHPSYDKKRIKNDIAILTIAEKVPTYDSNTFPRRIHSNLSDYKSPCYVMGWGLTKAGGKLSNKFKVAQVQPVEPSQCQKEWEELYNPNLICTSSEGNAACNGDSGGPLICENQFAGIVSFGKPCATGKPDMFTAVNCYNDWIDSVLRQE